MSPLSLMMWQKICGWETLWLMAKCGSKVGRQIPAIAQTNVFNFMENLQKKYVCRSWQRRWLGVACQFLPRTIWLSCTLFITRESIHHFGVLPTSQEVLQACMALKRDNVSAISREGSCWRSPSMSSHHSSARDQLYSKLHYTIYGSDYVEQCVLVYWGWLLHLMPILTPTSWSYSLFSQGGPSS